MATNRVSVIKSNPVVNPKEENNGQLNHGSGQIPHRISIIQSGHYQPNYVTYTPVVERPHSSNVTTTERKSKNFISTISRKLENPCFTKDLCQILY